MTKISLFYYMALPSVSEIRKTEMLVSTSYCATGLPVLPVVPVDTVLDRYYFSLHDADHHNYSGYHFMLLVTALIIQTTDHGQQQPSCCC